MLPCICALLDRLAAQLSRGLVCRRDRGQLDAGPQRDAPRRQAPVRGERLSAGRPASLKCLPSVSSLWLSPALACSHQLAPCAECPVCVVQPQCSPATVAVYDYPTCAGLCHPSASLPKLHADAACSAVELDPATHQLPKIRPFFSFLHEW